MASAISSRIRHAIPLRRYLSSRADPILQIPSASIYRFSASNAARPTLYVDWTIQNGESWAIVGKASDEKTSLLETLQGNTRIKPSPPNGVWPFLYSQGLDPAQHVRSVSFAHAPRAVSGGGFYDYSAKYGAVREGDAVTLRQFLFESAGSENAAEQTTFALEEALELQQFLDLPLVALSNGQTRRARIAKALLRRPQVLILDEPLTGLDKDHRLRLMSLLRDIHQHHRPHIIISLRMQDPVPNWITHVALVQQDGHVVTGEKASVLANVEKKTFDIKQTHTLTNERSIPDTQRAVVVDLRRVNVAYHERHILKNINWTIREGERWILQGPNGSGKTTLLSMITGDHPQSYTQAHLHLFGTPRRCLATPTIAQRIGICSPEIYNAFPRRSGAQGLSVRDAIASGFDGIFTYRRPTFEQSKRVDTLLAHLGPAAWSESAGPSAMKDFGERNFADLTQGEQALVMLLRAFANDPKLLILDEALSGMDSQMAGMTRRYLREHFGEKQAIVWVSHWESEAPWDVMDGVKKYSIENGWGRPS